MKKYIIAIIFICSQHTYTLAQLGIDFHQSNLPFIGLTYDLKERFLTEFRISTDVEISSVSPELIFAYKIARTETFNFYAGIGARANVFYGAVIPIGVALYPFENKQFGFQIEAAPLIGEVGILRGSWGIRYRFR
jgi:hypothetical protein